MSKINDHTSLLISEAKELLLDMLDKTNVPITANGYETRQKQVNRFVDCLLGAAVLETMNIMSEAARDLPSTITDKQ